MHCKKLQTSKCMHGEEVPLNPISAELPTKFIVLLNPPKYLLFQSQYNLTYASLTMLTVILHTSIKSWELSDTCINALNIRIANEPAPQEL